MPGYYGKEGGANEEGTMLHESGLNNQQKLNVLKECILDLELDCLEGMGRYDGPEPDKNTQFHILQWDDNRRQSWLKDVEGRQYFAFRGMWTGDAFEKVYPSCLKSTLPMGSVVTADIDAEPNRDTDQNNDMLDVKDAAGNVGQVLFSMLEPMPAREGRLTRRLYNLVWELEEVIISWAKKPEWNANQRDAVHKMCMGDKYYGVMTPPSFTQLAFMLSSIEVSIKECFKKKSWSNVKFRHKLDSVMGPIEMAEMLYDTMAYFNRCSIAQYQKSETIKTRVQWYRAKLIEECHRVEKVKTAKDLLGLATNGHGSVKAGMALISAPATGGLSVLAVAGALAHGYATEKAMSHEKVASLEKKTHALVPNFLQEHMDNMDALGEYIAAEAMKFVKNLQMYHYVISKCDMWQVAVKRAYEVKMKLGAKFGGEEGPNDYLCENLMHPKMNWSAVTDPAKGAALGCSAATLLKNQEIMRTIRPSMYGGSATWAGKDKVVCRHFGEISVPTVSAAIAQRDSFQQGLGTFQGFADNQVLNLGNSIWGVIEGIKSLSSGSELAEHYRRLARTMDDMEHDVCKCWPSEQQVAAQAVKYDVHGSQVSVVLPEPVTE